MRLKKTYISIVLVLALCIGCTGCKSEETKNVEALINQIDKSITLESDSGIEQAEEAYNALADKSEVSNSKKLTDARAEYDALYQKEVSPIENAIAEIPEITESNADKTTKSKIIKARSLYDKASDETKAAVPNYDVLVNAENAFADIEVKAAVDAIDKIGTVALDSEDLIDAASDAYQAVPKARRADVTNYSVLTEAKSTLSGLQKEAAEQAKQQALARLKKKEDTVENITWYYPASYPKYINSRSFVLPYIGVKNDSVWMRLVFDYAGRDWIFMEKAVINVDGEVVDTVEFNYFDVERDTAYNANLYEAVDVSPSASDISTLKKIANSNNATVRFKGQYDYDLAISNQDKQGIKDILAVYDTMK